MYIQEENEFLGLLDTGSEDLNIINLIEKYSIKTDDSFLYSLSDDYRALLHYVCELYFEQEPIPNDIIEEIVNNKNLKSSIIILVEEKMSNILFDSTTIVFKEIVTIVDLLSMGKNYNIFENYNSYNLENLSSLFRTFEENLRILEKEDELDFDITFKQYTLLIETINQVCSINSMDVIRKKTIKPLVEVISETINLVKFNIELPQEKINILNNILGKLLFYYSHIPFINASNKDIKYLIDEFHFNFEKICDGYELSKNTNFANESSEGENYKIFLNSSTTLICNLLYKLESNYPKELYNNLSYFEDIFALYKEEITHKPHDETFKTLNEFKTILLNNYMYIYDEKRKESSYKIIIEDFLDDKMEDYTKTFILHAVILFSNDIEDEKLIKVLKKLISTEKYRNDYHEFLKLTICDIIIKKFVDNNKLLLEDILINQIIDYVKENKIASHLMSIYSKIYLTLSAYYSICNDFISIDKSKLFYFYYVKINGNELLENEFAKLNKTILLNHGNRYIQDLKLEDITISEDKALDIGIKILKKFIAQEEITLKYNINQKLSNIITQIFTDNGLNDDLLNSHIENFISNDIFHGLAFVAVEGLCQNECKLIDLGYERIDIPLFDKFVLKIAYSKVYKHIFQKIFDDNISYIKQNIINLIVCYQKNIPIYNDINTTLYNIEKLKIDLLKRDDDEFIFIEIYVKDLMNLNKKYGYEKINIYFKEYALKINTIHPTYRLNGPKLALIIEKDEDYKKVIEKIKNIDFLTKDETIKPELTIAVSWGDKSNIIEKSILSLNLAEENYNKYYEFK